MNELQKSAFSNDRSSECLQKPGMVTKQLREVRQHTSKPHHFIVFMAYLNYFIMLVASHLRDLIYYFVILGKLHNTRFDTDKNIKANVRGIFGGFEAFFVRNIFVVGKACFNHPIATTPGTEIGILDRNRINVFTADFQLNGRTINCLNFGSYNYLGSFN